MHIFGPVPSRRLGLSLGIDPLNCKSCNLNCVYCELGRTIHYVAERKIFVETSELLAELREYFNRGGKADFLTFSGSGEPTLALNLEEMIDAVKTEFKLPVALITNTTLFTDSNVRSAAAKADVLLPSIDAAVEDAFIKADRPHQGLKLNYILGGFREFCAGYKGRIWVEVMLVKGINDSVENIKAIAGYLDLLPNIEKIQVNTVVRARAEDYAEPLSREELETAKNILGPKAEVIGKYTGRGFVVTDTVTEAVVTAAYLRPMRVQDFMKVINADVREIFESAEKAVRDGKAEKLEMNGETFYRSVK
jgi:wyosine [tRNA(Phe)-imidazoG37] synthetase (radical SAM superfamily)